MNVLVFRLSAMGDVAMSTAVLSAFSEQHPKNKIFMLTNKLFNPLFTGIPNITLINPDFKGKHKNIFGLYKLFKELQKEVKPDIIIDIHDVLRTKIIRFFFRLKGTDIVKIDKGRKEKKQLTRKKNKLFKQLKHSIQRYADTFKKAGLPLTLNNSYTLNFNITEESLNLLKGKEKKIGVAPFAKHLQKQYPLEMTEELIKLLSENNYKIFIFGGGKKEKEIAENLEKKYTDTISVIGKFSLENEIALINKLDVMITLDSGNMHLAALTSVNIISIWGATHPFAGFTPFVPAEKNHIIQNNNLHCRPCSVFGNKKCYKKTLECLYSVNPNDILRICKKITG
ncbi:MAG: glycosyltransferase family 9 protein [Chlorobi bacterium]|nr:glycosyltransferase family 9 protein [Chlorobiota bacterium]